MREYFTFHEIGVPDAIVRIDKRRSGGSIASGWLCPTWSVMMAAMQVCEVSAMFVSEGEGRRCDELVILIHRWEVVWRVVTCTRGGRGSESDDISEIGEAWPVWVKCYMDT